MKNITLGGCNLRRIIFSLVPMVSVCIAIYFSFGVPEANYAMAGVWLTFGLFTFTFGWPEVAESISFLGNKIKLREVKSTIDELKQLAELNVSALLEIIQTQIRLGGFPEGKKEEVFAKTTDLLKNLGFCKKEINRIQSRWHYWIEMDYVHCITHSSNINHPEVPDASHKKWHTKREEILTRRDSIKPNDLRGIFGDINGYTESVKTAIDDFEYYKEHKKHRNLERWEKRNDWFARTP